MTFDTKHVQALILFFELGQVPLNHNVAEFDGRNGTRVFSRSFARMTRQSGLISSESGVPGSKGNMSSRLSSGGT